MSHKFIPGEKLIFIGERLSPYHSFKKDEHVEFKGYTQNGGMWVSRYIQAKNTVHIPIQHVPYFIRDWKVRDEKIDEILKDL